MNHTNTKARAMALDLATSTGWAVIGGGLVTSGAQCFADPKRKGVTYFPGARFCRFESWLKTMLTDNKPTVIAYEEVYRWSGASAAHVFCGFRALLLAECAKGNIRAVAYTPSEIKKYMTGKGNADKLAMMAEAERRWPGIDLADDNHADALALLHLHLATTIT